MKYLGPLDHSGSHGKIYEPPTKLFVCMYLYVCVHIYIYIYILKILEKIEKNIEKYETGLRM